ncbi:MAG: hypothetical protein ACTSRG_05815 [Candidatus Helarchaeota archaeon]
MKIRKFLPLIIAGFLVIPIVIALNGVSNSYNLPIAIPNQISFQLSSLRSFQQNVSISPQDPTLNELQPRIVIDSNDIKHIVYVNSSNNHDIIYSNSSNYNIGKIVSNNPYSDDYPRLAYDSKNKRIYIAWQAFNGTDYNVVIANSSDYFSKNISIAHNATQPDIAVDSNGVVHVVWRNKYDEIFYTNSSVNYASITTVSNNSGENDQRPCIAIGSDNTVHIAWQGEIGGENEIYYANSTNNFQTNQTISNNPGNMDEFPDIIATNPVYIVWSGNNSLNYLIYIANSSGNWANVSISDIGVDSFQPVVTKGPGNLIHVIWTENATNYNLLYTDGISNYKTNTTIDLNYSYNPQIPSPDIVVDSQGRIHIVWASGRRVWYQNSTYPSAPSVRTLESLLIPLDLAKPGTAMLVKGQFYDELMIDKVEIMWSTNTGISWNSFLMFGSTNSNGTVFDGLSTIPGYQYGVILLFKYKITDKAGIIHETTQQIFYYPDTRTESIVLIIVLFGVLGTLTALYLIPQTREFFGKLFSGKKEIPVESKKPIA